MKMTTLTATEERWIDEVANMNKGSACPESEALHLMDVIETSRQHYRRIMDDLRETPSGLESYRYQDAQRAERRLATAYDTVASAMGLAERGERDAKAV